MALCAPNYAMWCDVLSRETFKEWQKQNSGWGSRRVGENS